jgi:hypothetical protein
MLTSFYQAFAPTSFTLLGLWLVVVQTRHAEWRKSAALRTRAYAVTLNFALPGLMSLLSLIDPASKTEWRVAFAAVAIGGLLALGALVLFGQVQGRGNPLAVLIVALALVGYALVAIVAIAPGITSNLGPSLTALRCEAILLSLLIFLGVNVAWLLMFDEAGI